MEIYIIHVYKRGWRCSYSLLSSSRNIYVYSFIDELAKHLIIVSLLAEERHVKRSPFDSAPYNLFKEIMAKYTNICLFGVLI